MSERDDKPGDQLKQLMHFLGVPFRDVGGPGGLPEDERIKLIAEKLREMPGKKVSVMVELADPKKGNRYIEKIRQAVPGVLVMNRDVIIPGPDGVENISFLLPESPK